MAAVSDVPDALDDQKKHGAEQQSADHIREPVHPHVDATRATSTMIVPDTIVAIHHNARRFVTSATIGGTSPHNAIAASTCPLGNEGPPLLTSAPSDGRTRPTPDLVSHSNAGRASVAIIKSPAIGAAHPPRQSKERHEADHHHLPASEPGDVTEEGVEPVDAMTGDEAPNGLVPDQQQRAVGDGGCKGHRHEEDHDGRDRPRIPEQHPSRGKRRLTVEVPRPKVCQLKIHRPRRRSVRPKGAFWLAMPGRLVWQLADDSGAVTNSCLARAPSPTPQRKRSYELPNAVDPEEWLAARKDACGLSPPGGSYYFLDLTTLGRKEEWEEPKDAASPPGRPGRTSCRNRLHTATMAT